MKRYIKSAKQAYYDFQIGDIVTVYNGMQGYANYDGEIVDIYTNSHDVVMAVVRSRSGDKDVSLSSIIPSQRDYFYSLSISDILSTAFLAKMQFKNDSMWCDRVNASRVDRDPSIENTVGYDAYISPGRSGYDVSITEYVSKNYSTTSYSQDAGNLPLTDPIFDEAFDIMRSSNKVVVNFAGYQRVFER